MRGDLIDLVEEELARVERKLGRSLEHPITVVLAPNRSEFQRLVRALSGRAPGDEVLGIAFPGRRWMLARADVLPPSPLSRDAAYATLAHELAHLVIHRDRDVVVPRYLDEGIAMWASGHAIPPADAASLSGLARLRGIYSLAELEREFPSRHHPAALAYQQSQLLVSYLVERHGRQVIPALLDGLEAGRPAAAVLEGVTSLPGDELEEGFRLWLAARHSILEALVSVVSVWSLITLLALVAIARSVWRSRRLRRRLESQEETDPDPDPGAAGPEAS